MNFFISKREIFFIGILLLASLLLGAFTRPDKNGCPADVQRGEVDIQIPAGALAGTTEVQIIRCGGQTLQTTAGMMLQAPVVANGVIHHDSLILSVYLLDPQPGPADVTVWWRLD